MVPSASTDWLMAQTEKETEKETWSGRERRRKQGRETQTDRKTERLIRICLFSLVRQGLSG